MAKLKIVKPDMQPASNNPGRFAMLALAVIETLPQVRSTMNEEALQELAADIKANGIIEPIIVRQHPDDKARYIVIDGHRRFSAARFAELAEVPTMIRDETEQQAELLQIAANIHREELTTEDEAKAVRRIYDAVGSLAKTCAFLNKSKGWVSKRLQVTMPGFSTLARQLLEGGATDDLEILNVLSTLEPIDKKAAEALGDAIKKGTANRSSARQTLKEAKARKVQADTAATEKEKEAAAAKLKTQPGQGGPTQAVFLAHVETDKLFDAAIRDKKNITAAINSYPMDHRAAMNKGLAAETVPGTESAKKQKDGLPLFHAIMDALGEEAPNLAWKTYARLAGLCGIKADDLGTFLPALQSALGIVPGEKPAEKPDTSKK